MSDAPKPEGVFDFSDLQALREEYEERITRLERERDAAMDVVKRDADARIRGEASARQELIQELTIELAGAREDGERRAMESDKRRFEAVSQLAAVRNDVARVEAELARIREVLDTALSAPAPAPAEVSSSPPMPTGLPASVMMPPVPQETSGGVKKRRIRLR